MKLAYFSPMPPARTGIATYSRQLVRALDRVCDITVFTPTQNADPLPGIRMMEFPGNPMALKSVPEHDEALFHIGNNPWFHLDIWKALAVFPGAVCLHDLVIYYLAAGMGRGTLLKELLMADPANALADLDRIERESVDGNLLRYATPSRHPCVKGLLKMTPHVLVHNRTSADALREMGYEGRVSVIPMLHYADEFPRIDPSEAAALRSKLGFGESDFVFGALGFIGPTKRLSSVLRALATIRGDPAAGRAHMLVVGEGESIDDEVRALGLESCVKRLGYVSDAEFRAHLAAVDAVVNLRYPSHGESSASLIQAMSYGKACIVTDHGSFGEMPDDTVIKIPHDEGEIPALVERLRALVEDELLSERIGQAAQAHIASAHAPEAVARALLASLGNTAPKRRAEFDPADYLRQRAALALPADPPEPQPDVKSPRRMT